MQTDTITREALSRGMILALRPGQRIWIRKYSIRDRGWYSAEVLRGRQEGDAYPLARFDDPDMGWGRTDGQLAAQFGPSTSFWNVGGTDCDVALMSDEEREEDMAITQAPIDPETLPHLSQQQTGDLEPGTRLLVKRSGAWHGAEVIAKPPGSTSTRMLMKFDEPGLSLGWNGLARYSNLADEDTYYWHDGSVFVVLDPSGPTPEGVDVTRIELPETPQWVEHWEPPTRPRRVESRWVLTRIANHLFHILYMGDCLSCGYGTYTTPDGSVPSVVGGRTLVVVKDGDKRVRMCYNCARTEGALARGLENAKDRTDTAPIEWPEEKMDLRLRHPAKVAADDEDD